MSLSYLSNFCWCFILPRLWGFWAKCQPYSAQFTWHIPAAQNRLLRGHKHLDTPGCRHVMPWKRIQVSEWNCKGSESGENTEVLLSLRMDGEGSKWDTRSRVSAAQALPDHHDKTDMALGQRKAAHSSATEYLGTAVCRSTEKERDPSTARGCQSTGRQLRNTGCSTTSAKFEYNLLRPSDVLHYFKISIIGEKWRQSCLGCFLKSSNKG